MITLATNVSPVCDRIHHFFSLVAKVCLGVLNRKRDKSRKTQNASCQRMYRQSRAQSNRGCSHCSESLFTWTTFQGCCTYLLRRNAHSSSRLTKRVSTDSRDVYALEKVFTPFRTRLRNNDLGSYPIYHNTIVHVTIKMYVSKKGHNRLPSSN